MKVRKLRKRHYEKFWYDGTVMPYDWAKRKGLIYAFRR